MDLFAQFLDFFIHLNSHLADILAHYGTLTYAILFLIIFCETGLVVMPLLPGDSLLFASGALLASTGQLNVFFFDRLINRCGFGWRQSQLCHWQIFWQES